MIAYQTYNEIRFLRDRKSMSCARIARRLHLCPRTVIRWATLERYEPRKAAKRSSILDPYKPAINRHWELGGCTYTSIFDSLRQAGHTGGQTMIKNYLRILGRKQPDRVYPHGSLHDQQQASLREVRKRHGNQGGLSDHRLQM
jgi:hypothetical protein